MSSRVTLWGRVNASNVLAQQSNTNKKYSVTVSEDCNRLRFIGHCAHIKSYTATNKLATHGTTNHWDITTVLLNGVAYLPGNAAQSIKNHDVSGM